MRNSRTLGVSFRVTFAAVLSLVAANALELNLPLWAVLTALIVTQISTGRSLKATIDYLVGTFCGAVFGALIALFIPHTLEAGLIGVLTLAIAPLVLLAAMTPSFAVGPATAVIVILLPTMTHGSSTASAVDRIMEVSLGGFIGLIVSYFVLPSRRSRFATDAMAQAIEELASGLHDLSTGAVRSLSDMIARRREKIEMVLVKLDAFDSYLRRHSRASSKQPRLQQQVRSIRRLYFDASTVGWVLNDAQIDAEARWLPKALQRIESTAACRLFAVAAVLRGDGRGSPLPLGLEQEFGRLDAEIRIHAGSESKESQVRDDGPLDRLLIAVDRLRKSIQALETVLFD